MKARDMIAGAAFGPGSLKDIQAAFAQAWDLVADNFSGTAEREAARVQLARTLLAIHSIERLPVDGLRDAALNVMQAQHPIHLAYSAHKHSPQARRVSFANLDSESV